MGRHRLRRRRGGPPAVDLYADTNCAWMVLAGTYSSVAPKPILLLAGLELDCNFAANRRPAVSKKKETN